MPSPALTKERRTAKLFTARRGRYLLAVSVQRPTIVLLYRRRADSFFAAARDLQQLVGPADVPGGGRNQGVDSCVIASSFVHRTPLLNA
jgi:hypothetical protein